MNKLQIVVLLGAALLFLVLYFGFDTKPKAQKAIEKSRALSTESASIEVLLRDAKAQIGPVPAGEIAALEQQLESSFDDSSRVEVLKRLSGKWYESGFAGIAGHYAEEVAGIDNSEEAWSIAGTTYTLCLQQVAEEQLRNFCSVRAVNAYEGAISINPANIAHKVNLALVYTEAPPADNPMQGVLMLRQLNEESPEEVLVINSLARLAIKTGQFDRAVERLQQAIEIDPENRNTICLLALAYGETGDSQNAQQYSEKCRSLTER